VEQIYRNIILDHYRHPRHFGRVTGYPLQGQAHNRLCGDELLLGISIEDGRVATMGFHGRGCAVCMAAASLACDHLPGTPSEGLTQWVRQLAAALAAADQPLPWPLDPLTPLRDYPNRHRCILLVAEALEDALTHGPLRQGQGEALETP